MFAHAHGVFINHGELVPREIYVAPIEKNPSYVTGFTIRPRTDRMTDKDLRTNAFARIEIHGMPTKPVPGDLDPRDTVHRLRATVGDEPLFVKGASQVSLFRKIFSEKDRVLIDIEKNETWADIEVLRRDIDFPSLDLDHAHLAVFHSRDHRKNCAMIKSIVYAHHLAPE